MRQDDDWWTMADNKMQKLLSSLLLSLSRHDSWKVRLALTASATKLLTTCQKYEKIHVHVYRPNIINHCYMDIVYF